MTDEVETAAADVATAEAALAAAEAEAARVAQAAETPAIATPLADAVDAEKADRPAGTAHVITPEVQTRYLNDRPGALVE